MVSLLLIAAFLLTHPNTLSLTSPPQAVASFTSFMSPPLSFPPLSHPSLSLVLQRISSLYSVLRSPLQRL